MKKFVLLFITMSLTCLLCGCGAENAPATTVPSKESSQVTPSQTQTENNTENSIPTPTMKESFISLGFSEDEAEQMTEIFSNIGITEIREIKVGVGTGIDVLQSFSALIYDSKNLQVNFTVEKRDLCVVSLAGVESYKPELYINFFGNLKVKELRTITSIDLFDRWVDDTDYHQPIEDSFIAKFDYENMEIIELRENSVE